jgi:glutamate-1-semialdehyde aminotransferase
LPPSSSIRNRLRRRLDYLEYLRAICDQHGILLIFDEVITGFGRLGVTFGANARSGLDLTSSPAACSQLST